MKRPNLLWAYYKIQHLELQIPEEHKIVNRVSNSALITFDLEAYYPAGERMQLDISQWLYNGLVLREKEFRAALQEFNWKQYAGAYVSVVCSTDAIVPTWAYMLVATKLHAVAKKMVQGDFHALEASLYQEALTKIDFSKYRDKMVIIKGCSDKPVPPSAYLWATIELMKICKKVMYGEACSSVPLYKRK